MTGPSSEQLQLQDEQMQFYKEGADQSRTTFAEDQSLLKQMEAVYQPILARGPNQNAFAGPEQNALDAQAIQGTAANYTRAARAVGENIAAEGGGENPLPSGSAEERKQEVAMAAAGQESAEEEQILQAGYATGEREFENAGTGLATVSGHLNPASYETAATSAGSAAETTAHEINQEQNSWEAPVFGAIGALGGAVLTGGMSNLGKGEGFFGNG